MDFVLWIINLSRKDDLGNFFTIDDIALTFEMPKEARGVTLTRGTGGLS